MKTENVKTIKAQKLAQYFKMRENLSKLSDTERRAVEKASGKLFSEIIELGATTYRQITNYHNHTNTL